MELSKKDNKTGLQSYVEAINQIQLSINAAFNRRKLVHFDAAKSSILEAIDAIKSQTHEFFTLEDDSVVYVSDPTYYPVLLRRSLKKVHPDWTEFQLSSKSMEIIEHEFEHGGVAIADPKFEGMVFGVMFVEDIADGQAMVQPFMKVKGDVDHRKIASAPAGDQSAGDKAFLATFV